MDFMDLLLADALAAGMARQATQARQRPPPDNFFVIPPDSMAWRKLYSACKEEHMVMCVEVTDDTHPPSVRAQPLFMELAREVSQIPFFRVRLVSGILGHSHDELRRDLGGIRFAPTIAIVFFGDDVRITKVEGENEISFGMRTGAIHRVIKEYIDQKVKLKITEQIAEELFKGAIVGELERRKRAQLDYERKLQIEKEEMERKEIERQQEERRQMEEEKMERLEAEKRHDEERRQQVIDDKRAKVEDELLKMDLNTTKISVIKEMMKEGGISTVGALDRADLLTKLKTKLPRLKAKLENSGQQQSNRDGLSGYRHSSVNEHDGITVRSIQDSNDVVRLKRRVEQLEKNVDELEIRRECLTDERDSLKKIIKNKEDNINQKNKELEELKNQRRPIRVGLYGSSRASSSNSKVQELEKELLETRLLYSCTLDDMDIMGVIAKSDVQGEGTVVRVKCNKVGLPDFSRVYAMKIVSNIHETSTMSTVRDSFKTEYEILSSLPHNSNIIKLFAFFYDRPTAHPKLTSCGVGIALCMLMEQLSQNLKEHISLLTKGNGPIASKTISWVKDVITGSHFLFSNNIVHRDMKLDNLLLSPGDKIKIGDFGSAIRLDSTMKLPYTHAARRGGNEAHLAPEILNVRAAPGKFINYTKQPVWEAGVLAYELAGHRSPFERTSIDQRSYSISSLPRLTSTYSQNASRQQSLPTNFTDLVQSMLKFNADERPTIEEIYKQSLCL